MKTAIDERHNEKEEFYRYRTKMLNRVYEDQELIVLYQCDSCFRSSVECAIKMKMSWEDMLIYALKNGYKFKQEAFEQSVKILQESMPKLNI